MRNRLTWKPTLLALLALVFILSCAPAPPAQAQLVVVTRNYRIAEVDPDHGRIKVMSIDGKSDQGAVLVGPDTRLFVFNKEIPNFVWHLLQKGMKITVKGGMTWDLKVKAHQIYI